MNLLVMNAFIECWQEVGMGVRRNAIEKGFAAEGELRNPGEVIALIHSELSECLESIRNGSPRDEHCPKFLGPEVELADAVIRIMDFADERGYDVPRAILAKAEYNKSRPHKHGKAF